MKILNSRAFVGFACFLVGALAVLAAQKLEGKLQFKNDAALAIDAHDPFEQMRQMRNRMMKDFDEPDLAGGIFDSWYRNPFGGGDVGEIKTREDKDYVYYDIGIKGLDKKNFNFKIADGQISISGQTENKSEENGSGTYVSSSFHRSFPVPPDVDGKRVQVDQDKDRLTLKFPKVSTTG